MEETGDSIPNELAPFKICFFSKALGLFSSFCSGPCVTDCINHHSAKLLIILNQGR